jgi:hypothetical protein
MHFEDDFSKVLPIAVHGDAAIAGQRDFVRNCTNGTTRWL